MNKKNTQQLNTILKSTHISDFSTFCKSESQNMLPAKDAFGSYLKQIAKEHNLTLQNIFIQAGIPVGYGYKLLLGERHTIQRDVIIRLCYASRMSLDQTQSALKRYGVSPLYSRVPRDAFLILLFQERPDNIIQLNDLLVQNHFEPLRSSGIRD